MLVLKACNRIKNEEAWYAVMRMLMEPKLGELDYRIRRLEEKIAFFLADLLPAKLVYWRLICVWARLVDEDKGPDDVKLVEALHYLQPSRSCRSSGKARQQTAPQSHQEPLRATIPPWAALP